MEKVDLCHDGHELFRIRKQKVGEKEDVVGVSCYQDESGVVNLSVDNRTKIWNEHMKKMMNFENEE